VTFDLTLQDLIDIATDECPIFHTKFVWGSSGLGKGKTRNDTPQLDKIFPEFGYIKGNIAFLSAKANKMKDNGTMQDHYDIADWIWSHTHVKQKSAAPVSTGDNREVEIYPELGAFSATGTGEDYYDLDHYQRTIRGEDADYRTKTRGGDGVGYGSTEVGAPIPVTCCKGDGERCPAAGCIGPRCGHIPD
jgi:hypothetical protein